MYLGLILITYQCFYTTECSPMLGDPDKKQKVTTLALYQHTHRHSSNNLLRCCGVTINRGWFNALRHQFSATQTHVAAFAAMLVPTHSFFRVEGILGHTLFTRTAIFTDHQVPQLVFRTRTLPMHPSAPVNLHCTLF